MIPARRSRPNLAIVLVGYLGGVLVFGPETFTW